MTASAADGVSQIIVNFAAQSAMIFSAWMKVGSGTGKARLRIKRRDGTLLTSADLNLTTTWQRFYIATPIYPGGTAANQVEVHILNGSDAIARDIWVDCTQGEQATSGIGLAPTSFIFTPIANACGRVAETFVSDPGTWPASFSQRGFKVDLMPGFSSLEMTPTSAISLVGFDNSPLLPLSTFLTDLFRLVNEAGTASTFAPTTGKLLINAQNGYPSQGVFVPSGQRYSEPFTWNAYTVLGLTAEAYRGTVRVEGALTGNGWYSVGGGPWTFGPGTFAAASNNGNMQLGASSAGPLLYGILTAA
jgi:hypothetical protein